MAGDTIAFLETVVGGPAHLVGHSDGMPVALLVALERPDLVRRLVLASGVFHHSGWAPGVIDLDDDVIAFFTEWHGEVAPDGPDHFPVLYEKLHRMQSEEPTLTLEDISAYEGPTLVVIGDEDEEVPLEHTGVAVAGAPARQPGHRPPRRSRARLPVSKPLLFPRDRPRLPPLSRTPGGRLGFHQLPASMCPRISSRHWTSTTAPCRSRLGRRLQQRLPEPVLGRVTRT